MILDFSASIKVWARVYFYCIAGTAASIGFFASPGRAWLLRKLNNRNHPRISRTRSQEDVGHPSLGLPNDPGRDVDEALEEIKQEIEMRRRRGSVVTMPTGQELRKILEDKLDRKRASAP